MWIYAIIHLLYKVEAAMSLATRGPNTSLPGRCVLLCQCAPKCTDVDPQGPTVVPHFLVDPNTSPQIPTYCSGSGFQGSTCHRRSSVFSSCGRWHSGRGPARGRGPVGGCGPAGGHGSSVPRHTPYRYHRAAPVETDPLSASQRRDVSIRGRRNCSP